MDIRDFKNVRIINTSEGRIVSSAFSIGHGEYKDIDTRRQQEKVLNDLNFFYEQDKVRFEELVEETKHQKGSINIQKITTEHGVEHTVFNPNKAINVEEIDTSGKAVNMGFSTMDAIDMLGKHWKSLEKEVSATTDVTKLKILLSVAREQEITGKKLEIIQDRLSKLK